tara:strand:+ start:4601 stop:4903 length:303 start_codon:yes stop_codon:yes gene_type:complete
LDDEYSLEVEDKRAGGKRRKKQKSSRRGRRTTEEKLAQVDRHEDFFSEDLSPGDCTLLANSAIVHADETGWIINLVWAFLSEQVRIILFGVHKHGATLAT